jgi:hypothetical protein
VVELAAHFLVEVALVELMVVVVVVVVFLDLALELAAQERQAWLFLNGDKYESTYSN